MNGYLNASELYTALDRGTAIDFNYNGEIFKVCKPGIGRTEITDSQGNTAFCGFYLGALIDYQGIAHNLQTERKTQHYNKEGNLI